MLAYGTGSALLRGHAWDLATVAAAVVAVTLAATLGMGMAQARRIGITQLRRRALEQPRDTALATRVRRGAVRAGVLRGLIGALSLTLLALGVRIAA